MSMQPARGTFFVSSLSDFHVFCLCNESLEKSGVKKIVSYRHRVNACQSVTLHAGTRSLVPYSNHTGIMP